MRGLCSLQFKDPELAYLRSMRFIKSDFVDFLGLFRLNEKYVSIVPLPSGELEISIKGPWLYTILFEIPLLAIVKDMKPDAWVTVALCVIALYVLAAGALRKSA